MHVGWQVNSIVFCSMPCQRVNVMCCIGGSPLATACQLASKLARALPACRAVQTTREALDVGDQVARGAELRLRPM